MTEGQLTTKPILLPKPTSGCFGLLAQYVLFGDWPQSLKEEDVVIDESKTYKINNWTCYKGSDGGFYVKEVSNTPLISVFSNNKLINDKESYFYKLESIKWCVLSDSYQGGKLLLAENVLAASPFDIHFDMDKRKEIDRNIDGKTVYPNNYEYSTIRAYLNSLDGTSYGEEDFRNKGFLARAFTSEVIEKLNTIKVDNSFDTTFRGHLVKDKSEYKDYVCNDTLDKVFLLSENDFNNQTLGFKGSRREDERLLKTATDYARAMGSVSLNLKGKNASWWWLRSPNFQDKLSSYSVGSFAYILDDSDVFSIKGGVVPLISLSF